MGGLGAGQPCSRPRPARCRARTPCSAMAMVAPSPSPALSRLRSRHACRYACRMSRGAASSCSTTCSAVGPRGTTSALDSRNVVSSTTSSSGCEPSSTRSSPPTISAGFSTRASPSSQGRGGSSAASSTGLGTWGSRYSSYARSNSAAPPIAPSAGLDVPVAPSAALLLLLPVSPAVSVSRLPSGLTLMAHAGPLVVAVAAVRVEVRRACWRA
mmetsp:Transcript_38163/g.96577  ORF Transcript_38163/g.96577 Transcript_38163/m.96577 type:complete len:213 (-) Transcript_38163:1021-1659(-)